MSETGVAAPTRAPVPAPLVVGFDLDMTLIDTVPGFAATLEVLGRELGVDFPIAEMTAVLGPPLDQVLAPYLAPEQLDPAGDRFRELYPDTAIPVIPALPGAHEALAAVRRAGGRIMLVTGKFPATRSCTSTCSASASTSSRAGSGSRQGRRAATRGGEHLRRRPHPRRRGRPRGGRPQRLGPHGGCTADELRSAGTDVVLDSLLDFPDWLDEHLLAVRLAALEADLRERGSVLVSYSGGADSAFLLAAAVRALGPDRVVAATGYSDAPSSGRARSRPGPGGLPRGRGADARDPRDGP